jgi:hypothetical protein
LRPLAVHMMLSTLARTGGGKYNVIGVEYQGINESRSVRFGQMLGNLHTQCYLETSAEIPGFGKVLNSTLRYGNEKLFLWNIDAVHAENIRNAEIQGGFQPRAKTAADVEHTLRSPIRENVWQCSARAGNRVGISIMRIVDAHKADRSGHGCGADETEAGPQGLLVGVMTSNCGMLEIGRFAETYSCSDFKTTAFLSPERRS